MDTLSTLPTPAFVVDLDRVLLNTAEMFRKAHRSAVHFRPHVKTHKTVEIALLQGGGEPGPITVSTLAEAEFFADAGFRDITYAFPITPDKLARAAALASRIDSLNLLLDNREAFRAIEEFCAAHGIYADVFLKVDCGYGRAGVDRTSPEAVSLATELAGSKAVTFRGLLTHAGHSYHARTRVEILAVAAQETAAVSEFAATLRGEGIDDLIRSVGSTPTASVVDSFADCDEVRPGNYVFYDAFQSTIGSCRLDQCAATVVTTVAGVYPAERRAIIDAGALALSKDLGPDHIDPRCGYGLVCDLDLKPLPLKIVALSQEHGKVAVTGDIELHVGSRLRIVPNHSCLTAALFDRYAVARGQEVVDEWRPVCGW